MSPPYCFLLSREQSLYWNSLQHIPAGNLSIARMLQQKYLKYYINLYHAKYDKMNKFLIDTQLLTFLIKLMFDGTPNFIFWLSVIEPLAGNEVSKRTVKGFRWQSNICLAKLTTFLKLYLFRFNRFQQMKRFMLLIALPILLKSKKKSKHRFSLQCTILYNNLIASSAYPSAGTMENVNKNLNEIKNGDQNI